MRGVREGGREREGGGEIREGRRLREEAAILSAPTTALHKMRPFVALLYIYLTSKPRTRQIQIEISNRLQEGGRGDEGS
jgi:hypothetical protein